MVKDQIIRIRVQGVVEGLDKITNQTEKFNRKMLAMQAMSKKLGVGVDATNSIFKQAGLQMAKSGNSIKENNKRVIGANRIWDIARSRVDSFSGVMGLNFEAWQRINVQGREFQSRGGRIANTIRKMTTGMKGFKMELLGVMFFGMALFRAMSGLLRTAIEWTGVTEVMSTALGLLFLPVALKLLDWALAFLDFVSGLTEEQKKWIGSIVLALAALGGLLMIVGQLGLGIGSLVKLFSGIGGIVGPAANAMVAALGGVVAPILLIIGIIIAIIVGMVLAWKENFLGMRAIVSFFVGGLASMFGGLIEIFKGIFMVIKAIFTGDVDLLLDGFKKIFEGLVKFLVGLVKVVLGLVAGIVVGILRIIVGAIQLVVNLLGKIPKLFGGKGFEVDFLGKMSSPKSFQTGGVVPGSLGSAVPIIAHAGERVVPVGGFGRTDTGVTNNTSAPIININANVSGQSDIFALSDEISRRMGTDFERLTKTRATF